MTDPTESGETNSPGKPQPIIFDRNLLFQAFFFTAFLYLLYQLALILSPFLAPLLGALMLTLIFYPMYARLRLSINNTHIAAGLSTAIVLITIVVPILILMWMLINETTAFVPIAREWIMNWGEDSTGNVHISIPAPLQELWARVHPYIEDWNLNLQSMFVESVRELGNTITSFGAATLRGAFTLLINIIVLVFMLFFFFRDGEQIVRKIIGLVPMEEDNKQLIVSRLDRTLVAIIRGGFITASAQGMLTGIGLAIFGVPFAVLLGFTSALLSVVPFVGASLVWAPASVYLLVNDQIGAGIGLIFWGLFVVGLIDNFLRPWVVGTHAQLPILLLFVGILGGLQVYGLIGALVSPLVVVAVLVFAQIYHDQYLQDKSPESSQKTPDNG